MRDSSFHLYVTKDILSSIPGITSKPMFGGYGIFKDGVIFAIIADGELYFKVNKNNKNDYIQKRSHPFTYRSKGKTIEMSYWVLPQEIMEDKTELPSWIDKSIDPKSKFH